MRAASGLRTRLGASSKTSQRNPGAANCSHRPAFSDSARADDFDVQREHVRLLRACADCLTTEGVLYFSNNFRRFKLDADAVAQFAHCEEITPQTIDPDFERNPRIHRCWGLMRN